MHKLIRKADAAALAGSPAALQGMVSRGGTGELLLLPGGAKLYTTFVGCVRRYGVYGYTHDGSDVRQALASLPTT